MTSELKPIDIWDDATNAVCQAMQQSKMCKCPDGECLASTIEPSKETLAHWNTRAAPDVPELKWYTYDSLPASMCIDNVELVLHSQAAEIIAAKDVEIAGIKDCVKGLFDDRAYNRERAEAAEAKLAQYEAQEPVVYTLIFRKSYGVNAETTFKKFEDAEKYAIRCELPLSSIIPLYASPAPAADLKADLERKDAALRFYADTSKYPAPLTGGMGALWEDCGQIARAALNVEASNDKG
ncbi:hypothetical protein [Pseudochrobactrum saccharolyticum]|uniref:hypothetical protein n=1 Tax=Pseudochrobactrum saccharolyticum TaxID=354352 RepID=UPI00275AF875|nr:hypothetical protein [Pseudochrobactrum saccharolyticum]MDP8249954.1 hypothetical protein [Pseudochrobactrum saccharolyticum]